MIKTARILLCGLAALPLASLPALAQTASSSGTLSIPYSETWSNWQSELKSNVWTVEDKNGDGATWGSDLGLGDMVTYDGTNQSGTADDWLVSPPLSLQAGKSYKLVSSAWKATTSPTQTIAIAYGEGNDPSTYTEILAPTSITGAAPFGSPNALEATFSPKTTGSYRIGFHAVSDNGGYLILRSVNVDETAAQGGKPAPVTDLKATPGANGALSATVTFTIPTQDVLGNDLTDITRVQVYRNNGYDAVYTVPSPTAGQSVTWTDNSVTEGETTYSVVTTANDFRSDEASTQIYVGKDIPAAPKNIKVRDNLDGTTTVSWDPVTTGAHGGYVDMSNVNYTVSPYISGYENDPVAQGITATSTAGQNISYTGGQTAMLYAVGATSTSSTGEELNSDLGYSDYFFTGVPYDLPFIESFAGRALTYAPWAPSYNDTQNHFGFNSNSADNDGGSLIFSPANDGDQAMMGSPKIDLSTAANPVLTFQYYASTLPSQSVLNVYELVNGQDEKLVGTVDYSKPATTSGWQTVEFNLADDRLSLPNAYARIIFRAVANGTDIQIDNIRVQDQVANNLEVALTAPTNVQPGDEMNISVNANNTGSNRAENFKVNVYVNGTVVDTQEGLTLDAGKSETYSFKVAAPVDGTSFTLKAEAEWAADQNQNNNTVERTLNIVQSPLPPVTDLKAASENGVKLSWTAPEVDAPTINDSFETYEPFSMDNVGKWTLIDRDGGTTYTWNRSSGLSFPGMGSAFAYTVFNPTAMTANLSADYLSQFITMMSGHTGVQSMMSNGVTIDQGIGNDDWLISPELSGNAQTVTFWVKAPLCDNLNNGPETYTVWYSDTDNDPENFTQYRSGEADGTWQKVSIDLEEGTYYFAIQRTSTGGLSDDNFEPNWFAVDDVTYESAPLTITGYEIYRDNELVGTTGADATSWSDPEGADNSKYNVFVIYEDGKSAASNTVSVTSTGIDSVNASANADKGAWYDLQGRRIAHPTLHGVYIHNGKKYVK